MVLLAWFEHDLEESSKRPAHLSKLITSAENIKESPAHAPSPVLVHVHTLYTYM